MRAFLHSFMVRKFFCYFECHEITDGQPFLTYRNSNFTRFQHNMYNTDYINFLDTAWQKS